jgi:hypothetical protein
VKVQNIFDVENDITRSTNCKHRTAATLYTLDTLLQVYNSTYPALKVMMVIVVMITITIIIISVDYVVRA